MNHFLAPSRRMMVKSSLFGLLGLSIPHLIYSKNNVTYAPDASLEDLPHNRYPAISLDVASEVVGAAHFDLDRIKTLIEPRPELAKATWDWGFGDWESAIGAASHTGRKDIVDYLIKKGAIPTIFTYAMLGAYSAVKSMIDFYPGIQQQLGPHGISLLQHAKLALSTQGSNQSTVTQLIDYLERLGDADGAKYLPVEEATKINYLGDYKYGNGQEDGFTVRLNMKKALSLGKIGKFGGALYKIADHEFTYNGAPSVTIKFNIQNKKVVSLTLKEPNLMLTAIKSS